MNPQEQHESETSSKSKRRHQKQAADFLAGVVKTLTGALIGTALISLFGLVILAFVIKAFITSEEMSFQLLHSAITLVSTSLAAALGYFLGRSSTDKPEGGS
jgi:hypothetical protein